MSAYSIYVIATGEIVSTGSTPQLHAVRATLSPEQDLVEAKGDPQRERVIDGQIVSKDAAEIDAFESAQAWQALRFRRSLLLARTDWTQLPDSGRARAAWAQYRQALRDLPANTTDPRNVDWPEAPE